MSDLNEIYLPTSKERKLLDSIYELENAEIEKLAQYRAILLQWQKKTNLVAPSTLEFFWERHVADSIQVLAHYGHVRTWTDIGSGGGFPGMVMAILLGHKNAGKVCLVESIQKKAAFLRKVANDTNASAEVCAQRIESSAKQFEQADAISARALASLEKLLDFTDGYIQGDRFAVFHKGRDFQREIEECNGKWSFDLVVKKSKIDVESVLLEIHNAKRI